MRGGNFNLDCWLKSLENIDVDSLHGRQMSQNDVHRVDGVGAERLVQVHRLGRAASFQDVVQQMPADQRHKFKRYLERPILPSFPWQGHVQINLRVMRVQMKVWLDSWRH